jgi:hypothetical protein
MPTSSSGRSDGIIGEPDVPQVVSADAVQPERAPIPSRPQPEEARVASRPQLEPEEIWRARLERDRGAISARAQRQRMARLQATPPPMIHRSPSDRQASGQSAPARRTRNCATAPGLGARPARRARRSLCAALQAGLAARTRSERPASKETSSIRTSRSSAICRTRSCRNVALRAQARLGHPGDADHRHQLRPSRTHHRAGQPECL